MRSAGLCILFALLSLVGADAARASLLGSPVELRMGRGDGGAVQVERATILSEARSPKIRGPVDSVDADAREIVILGVTLLVESSTEIAFPDGFGSLEAGMLVQVKARRRGTDRWKAKAIEPADPEASWKIKGTIDSLGPDFVGIDGIRIAIPDGLAFTHEGSKLEEELFAVLRDDDGISQSLGGLKTPWGIGVSGSLRHHYRQERAFDAKPGSEIDLSEPSIRLELLGQPRQGWTAFSQLRWQGQFHLRDDEIGQLGADELSLQIRQLYLTQRRLGGLPLGLTLGKQRLKDDREFLFDEYLDGLRLQFYGAAPLVLEASLLLPVAPLKDKLEDWRDTLLRIRWIDDAHDAEFTTYALLRDDRSSRQRDARYYGVSAKFQPGPARAWLESVLLRGHDKGDPQRAWAYDLGLAWRANSWPGRPGTWISVAKGSGDASPSDGARQDFRQTGYEDNTDRIWGVSNLANYGEVLDPELSNLRVISAGLSIRAMRDLSVDLFWHGYDLAELTVDFDVSDLRIAKASLTGTDRRIGDEWGVALGWRDIRPGVHGVVRAARFVPGAAFGPPVPDVTRLVFEARWDF